MSKFLAAGLWVISVRELTVPYVGVPLNVLVACAIGAFCSFSFGDKVEPRSKMWGLYIASMFMGAAITAIANASVDQWTTLDMTDALQAGIGALVSFLARFFLPWLVDIVKTGKWLSWIPFLRSDK
jgi:hypothetical protein